MPFEAYIAETEPAAGMATNPRIGRKAGFIEVLSVALSIKYAVRSCCAAAVRKPHDKQASNRNFFIIGSGVYNLFRLSYSLVVILIPPLLRSFSVSLAC